MKQFYVYLHCKPDGTPFYVGKGCGKRSHEFGGRKRNVHHKRVVSKYGQENISVFVFPSQSESDAHKEEVQHIAQLRADGFVLCNMTHGGDGVAGFRHTEETRAQIAAKLKGRAHPPMSEEARAKMSAAKKAKAPWCKGKKLAPETLARMSASRTGMKLRPRSQASKDKMAETMRAIHARRTPDEKLAHIEKIKAGYTGKPHPKPEGFGERVSAGLRKFWNEKRAAV